MHSVLHSIVACININKTERMFSIAHSKYTIHVNFGGSGKFVIRLFRDVIVFVGKKLKTLCSMNVHYCGYISFCFFFVLHALSYYHVNFIFYFQCLYFKRIRLLLCLYYYWFRELVNVKHDVYFIKLFFFIKRLCPLSRKRYKIKHVGFL